MSWAFHDICLNSKFTDHEKIHIAGPFEHRFCGVF